MFCIFVIVISPPLSKPNWNKHLIEKLWQQLLQNGILGKGVENRGFAFSLWNFPGVTQGRIQLRVPSNVTIYLSVFSTSVNLFHNLGDGV